MTMRRLTLPMPALGETMEQGTVAAWLVRPGESFARGDAIVEVESDKTLVEYPALGSGKLIQTLVDPGDTVGVGAPIAVIETTDRWDGIEGEDTGAAATAPKATAQAAPPPAAGTAGDPQHTRPRATPLARRLARQAGIDLARLEGTGRRGRLEARDVRAALEGAGPDRATAGRGDVGGRAGDKVGTFLLIHGFAGDGSAWAALAAALGRGGFMVETPDLPGHGANAMPANEVADLVAWLAQTLRGQPEPVHLVGHSLGAHVAAEAAAAMPGAVSRLTLIAPAGCGRTINGTFMSGMAAVTGPGELAHLLRLLGPRAAALSAEARAAMSAQLAEGRLRALAAAITSGDTQRIDTIAPVARLADRIAVDAIFGLADAVVPKEHVFNMPPAVCNHVLPTGHMPQWDAPAEVERILLARP